MRCLTSQISLLEVRDQDFKELAKTYSSKIEALSLQEPGHAGPKAFKIDYGKKSTEELHSPFGAIHVLSKPTSGFFPAALSLRRFPFGSPFFHASIRHLQPPKRILRNFHDLSACFNQILSYKKSLGSLRPVCHPSLRFSQPLPALMDTCIPSTNETTYIIFQLIRKQASNIIS